MSAEQIAELLSQTPTTPEEAQAKADAENELLQADPSTFFLSLAEIALSSEDFNLISIAFLYMSRPIDLILNNNPDIDIFTHFNSVSEGIFSNILARCIQLMSGVPNTHFPSLGAFLCIRVALLCDLEELSAQMIEQICASLAEEPSAERAFAICETFDLVTDDFYLNPEQYQPLITQLFLIMYEDGYASSHVRAFNTLYNLIDSIDDIIQNPENRSTIYSLLGPATGRPELKPICYKIFGKIALEHYDLFGEIAEQTVTGALEYLNSEIEQKDKIAICYFFIDIAKVELLRLQEEEESLELIKKSIEALFPLLIQMATTFEIDSESDEEDTPQSLSLEILSIVATMLPGDVVPVLLEYVKENIQSEDEGGRYASYAFSLTALEHLEGEDFNTFATELLQAIPATFEDPQEHVTEAALICLDSICTKLISNETFGEVSEAVKQTLPALVAKFRSPILMPSVRSVITTFSTFDPFPELCDIFTTFLPVFLEPDGDICWHTAMMFTDIIHNVADLEELAKVVPICMEFFQTIGSPEQAEQPGGQNIHFLYYFLIPLFKKEYVAFKPFIQMLIETTTRDFIAKGECESIDVKFIGEIICMISRAETTNPFAEQTELFFNMCSYLIQQFGNPSDIEDGCSAINKFLSAKIFVEGLGEIKELILQGLTTVSNSIECVRSYIDLSRNIIHKFREAAWEVGFIDVIGFVNEYVPTIKPEGEKDVYDLVTIICDFYIELASEDLSISQWAEPIVQFIIIYSKVFNYFSSELDEYDCLYSYKQCTILTLLMFGNGFIEGLPEIPEEDKEELTQFFHLAHQEENLKVDICRICEILELPSPPLPEDEE